MLASKRDSAREAVNKLRQAEVELGKDTTMASLPKGRQPALPRWRPLTHSLSGKEHQTVGALWRAMERRLA